MHFNDLQPKVVLGVAAHPDDLELGAGGTMAKFAAQGADVYFLILTDGSGGTADRSMAPEHLAEVRREEQRNACEKLGVKDVFFCDNGDSCLENSTEVRREIVKYIRQLKPDAVITWDPSMFYSPQHKFINHPDHRASGQATLDAVFPLARDHLSYPDLLAEGYEPHKTSTVLLMNFNTHNFCVDIAEWFEIKMDARAEHVSQVSDIQEVRELFTGLAEDAAKDSSGQYAEAFMRIDIRNI